MKYIGKLNIKTLRDYILDNSISDSNTIILNAIDFDELALEYRAVYGENIELPYFLLGVLIREDQKYNIPQGRIQIIVDDDERYLTDYTQTEDGPDNSHQYDTIYRCGWCGDVVDFDGRMLDKQTREFQISIHTKFNYSITEKRVHGNCCKNRQ